MSAGCTIRNGLLLKHTYLKGATNKMHLLKEEKTGKKQLLCSCMRSPEKIQENDESIKQHYSAMSILLVKE